MDPTTSTDSPPLRSTILNSFLGRGRPPRNPSQSSPNPTAAELAGREMSPSPQPPQSRRLTGAGAVAIAASNNATSPIPEAVATSQSVPGSGLGFLRRRRSAGTVAQPQAAPAPRPASASRPAPPASNNSNSNNPFITNNNATHSAHAHLAPPARGMHRIRLVPHLENRRSLKFDAITRDLSPSSPPLRIGRFTDRSGLGVNAVNALGSNKLAFKSKVVSRAHAEIWVESSGAGASNVKFFIKDTKSSSGTFLNHVRLSIAGTESRPFQVKDGDIVQLGVDYQGGSEDVYKSVKIRVEVGREWQNGANKFNTNAIKNLKSLAQTVAGPTAGAVKGQASTKSILPDCCICLFPISIRQALFITPCSHTFHYKCIRPLVEKHFPGFSCPLCRTFADLEEDVEVDAEEDDEMDEALMLGLIDGAGGTEGAELVASNADGVAVVAIAAVNTVLDAGDDSEVEVVEATTLRQAQAQSRARATRERAAQALDAAGAETDVEPQISGPGPSGSGGASGSMGRRGRGHARNLSSQMDPMELIRDRDEEDDDQYHEVIDVDMLEAEDAMDQDQDQEQEFEEDAEEDDVEFVHGDGQGDSEGGTAGTKRRRYTPRGD
ncbi:hypothetical protein BT96DRAFT_851277 [Gymnopus androsaceus JB14]|uniref:SMAD/FHA domain-containing protein n=1 Tax=Gymnopus androsaceus JB14 TaxID=1447944 RepID=A0A6A4I8J9_9AGAR|nr:hypothetical protein BT96DRAFT_851277 [Gymnopus androsaceus JB14]